MTAAFFNETHVEPLRNLLDAGGTYRGIAAQYGCDHQTVRGFVRKHLPEQYERRKGQYASSNRPLGLKILIIDIETIAGTTRQWNSYQKFTSPDMIVKDTALFCFAAKWFGDDAVEFCAVDGGRAAMVTRAHELLSEADGVVTFNGDRFDLPHLNLEFLRSGMAPPAPYKSVDLIKTAKRKFKFHNNKLMRIAKTLGIGAKIEHEGWGLWEKCEAGDKAAWKRMRAYNVEDTLLTERLYLQYLPWLEGHPSHAALWGDLRCTNCGSEELTEKGLYHAKTRSYQRYQCDGCGKWQRGRNCLKTTEITETALS